MVLEGGILIGYRTSSPIMFVRITAHKGLLCKLYTFTHNTPVYTLEVKRLATEVDLVAALEEAVRW